MSMEFTDNPSDKWWLLYENILSPDIVVDEPNHTLSFIKSTPSTTWPAVGCEESNRIGADSLLIDSPAWLVTINFTI